jgi:hypothetical protein
VDTVAGARFYCAPSRFAEPAVVTILFAVVLCFLSLWIRRYADTMMTDS